MADLITLNVGGHLYTTTKSTLGKYPDSMLGVMIDGTFDMNRDSNGHPFIDRDGEMFKYILNFLRSTHLALPTDFKQLELLSVEADFYQIQPLLDIIHQLKKKDMRTKTMQYQYLEILEVCAGKPDNISRVKTMMSGKKDVIQSLLADISGRFKKKQKLKQTKIGPDSVELELYAEHTRFGIGELLRSHGWKLLSSDLSSSSSLDQSSTMSYTYNILIEQSFRDRWCLEVALSD